MKRRKMKNAARREARRWAVLDRQASGYHQRWTIYARFPALDWPPTERRSGS